ncbi:U-box domain-containing protein 62 isoform X1 [Solanum pennellii]|uniref:U-box domain-containing protein 62 isoform X1 n=1 Tax=Solanum pennellii TaxID=28526 RepID=A0ABM1GQG9_SOLPN|nr:U-box domain-containing protein 62 isoform X1 [Solanum pennellii]
MASEEMGLVSARRVENGLNSQLVFHESNFSCGAPPPAQPPGGVGSVTGDPGPKTTRELTGFNHQHQYFLNQHQPQAADFRRQMFGDDRGDGDWNRKSHGDGDGDGSEDEDMDDDEDDDDDENEVEGIVTVENSDHQNNNSDKVNSNSSGKVVGSDKTKSVSTFGVKEGNVGPSGNEGGVDVRNAVIIASVDGDMYYNQYLQGPEGSNAAQKEMGFENGCGFSGRKEAHYSNESGESLRTILSDPITGELMDDAMILPCGHSFGSGGVQHVIRMKVCYICSQAVSEDSLSPNLSLRSAIQAFRREEESQLNRSLKRRKERYDQDRGAFGDSALPDHLRGRGVQFPFAVTDRVIIKGNKRTPERFVGREAVVTTQCLNGWYVVKTLDNAESVKLQYRSLAKVPENLSIQPISSKAAAWL